MVNERMAFNRIDPLRSKQAFELLIQDWKGVLISDSYGCYTKWVDRQTCLAHLIRKLDALTERKKDAGKLARQIMREIDNLWVFLKHEGVEPTNNRAERALRFGVI